MCLLGCGQMDHDRIGQMDPKRHAPEGAIGQMHDPPPIILKPEVAVHIAATQFHNQEHPWIAPPAILMEKWSGTAALYWSFHASDQPQGGLRTLPKYTGLDWPLVSARSSL